MRWLIEIFDIVADKRFLADVLARLNVTLYLEDNRTYLTSNQFDLLLTSFEVWNQVERMRDVVSEVSNSFPGTSISFKLGDLYEQKEDGARNKHVFLSGSIVLETVLSGILTVTSTREISEEERAKLEAERLELEYQEKLALVSSRVLPVFQDERALKVHRFLQQELTPARMYHIFELIQDDPEGKLNSLSSKKERDRFTHSVNHPKVFGDNSRHIVLHKEPPAKPMSLTEAQNFILRLADLWFKQKCVDKSNA